MNAPPPIQQACGGKRWIASTTSQGETRVEVYVGATACGLLPQRVDLCAIRRPDSCPPACFDWGNRSAEAWLLSISILDDAFGMEPDRAIRLAPCMMDFVVSRFVYRSPWVLRYEGLALKIARWEDDLQEKA